MKPSNSFDNSLICGLLPVGLFEISQKSFTSDILTLGFKSKSSSNAAISSKSFLIVSDLLLSLRNNFLCHFRLHVTASVNPEPAGP